MKSRIKELLREQGEKVFTMHDLTPYYNVEKYQKIFEKIFVGKKFSHKFKGSNYEWFTNEDDEVKAIHTITKVETKEHQLFLSATLKCAFVGTEDNGVGDLSVLQDEALDVGSKKDAKIRLEEVNDFITGEKTYIRWTIQEILKKYFSIEYSSKPDAKFVQVFIRDFIILPADDEVINL